MGPGQQVGRDYEEEVPHLSVGPTPASAGENRDISGCLRSPPQAPISLPGQCLTKTGRRRLGQRTARWPGCILFGCALRIQLEGRQPDESGIGHALRAPSFLLLRSSKEEVEAHRPDHRDQEEHQWYARF